MAHKKHPMENRGEIRQSDMISIMLRLRKYKIAITADVEKMYRQIWVHSDQRDLQRVLWRQNSTDKVEEYTLNTVTYGTSNAPYIAIRVLNQLATDVKQTHSRASRIIEKDFYVDDMITGANSVNEAIEIYNDIKSALQSGKLNLRKFASNSAEFMKAIPNEDHEKNQGENMENVTKALGIRWNSRTDEFSYNFSSIYFTSGSHFGFSNSKARSEVQLTLPIVS